MSNYSHVPLDAVFIDKMQLLFLSFVFFDDLIYHLLEELIRVGAGEQIFPDGECGNAVDSVGLCFLILLLHRARMGLLTQGFSKLLRIKPYFYRCSLEHG